MDLRLVVISNRLPVTPIIEDEQVTYRQSIGGLATGISTYLAASNTGLSPVFSEYLWVGYVGISDSNVSKDINEQIRTTLLKDYHCYPIFLLNDLYNNFYEGFCNKIIWPLFHYFPDKVVYIP